MQLGSEVRVGDALVRIEPRELALALERAESALRQVEAQLGIDRAQDKQPPPDDQIASVRQAMANRDDARAAYRTRAAAERPRPAAASRPGHRRDPAEGQRKPTIRPPSTTSAASRPACRTAAPPTSWRRRRSSDAVVRAPVAGSVSERLVQPGEFIRENTPVATIVQMNPLKLRTAIQEKNAGVITVGQSVDFIVEAFPDRTFHGKVAFVSPAVDQATRTFPVEVLVDNADRTLKPGFFAKGTVLTRRRRRGARRARRCRLDPGGRLDGVS